MMRRLLVTWLLFSLSACLAHSQTAGWQSVQMLDSGTAISVVTKHRTHCRFLTATNSELTCQRRNPGPRQLGWETLTFQKFEIRELRLERPSANTATAVAIGATAGATAGAATGGNGSLNRTGTALMAGVVCGSVGWIVGKSTSFVHGRVIYRK